MITSDLKKRLILAAEKYETPDFILHDPIQFPHRFTQKRDIEVSGLLTALMSFGNRKQIIAKANLLHDMMNGSPAEYVIKGTYKNDFAEGRAESFYRMMSYGDFRRTFDLLHEIYSDGGDLESRLLALDGTPMERLCRVLGVSSKSPQKKVNMFLRWMVRRNSPVDFGIWTRFSAADLIIPLDTHVVQTAHSLGITPTPSYSLTAARKITATLAEAFPGDPIRGDFALFGAGVNADV